MEDQEQKKSRKGLYAVVAVILAVLVVFSIITYVIADAQITEAIQKTNIKTGDVEITHISLLPPSVDATGIIFIENPTDITLRINYFRAEIYVEAGQQTFLVGTLDEQNKVLPANGKTSATLMIHVGGQEIIDIITSGNYEFTGTGELSVSGQYLFWTITKEKAITVP